VSSERAVYRRVLRRETHSSRAGAAITVATFLILLLAAAATGCVFLILHLPTLAVVQATLSDITSFRAALRYPVLGSGILAAVLGLIILMIGILPGRKARRRLPSERAAVVVDENVIADSVADRVSRDSGADRGRVKVVADRRRVRVRIVPTSGIPLSVETATEAARAESAQYGLKRRPRVVVAENGTVG